MQLSPHFSLKEFTESDTALRLGIDNTLPINLMPAAENTATLMESIRGHLSMLAGRPIAIQITSGYRCQQLNRAVGSGPLSDHLSMNAIDFKASAFGTPLEVCKALTPVFDSMRIGQLIYEHTWVHVSTRTPDKAINRVLTVNGKHYLPGIVEA